MKKMINNKKASAYTFIYVLAFLFLLGIMFIIFNEILQVYMYPTSQYLAQDVATGTAKADKYLGFWQFAPFILVFVALLYLFLKSTQKDDNTFQ